MLSLAVRLLCGLCAAAATSAAAPNLDREIALSPHRGSAREDLEIVRFQTLARDPRANTADFTQLGWAYVAKARRTLDAGFYKLAEKTADLIDAEFGASAESRLLRGCVLHNLHRFREAEIIARQLVAERSSPADLALLSDALIDQGKLAEGMVVLQRLVDSKPSAEAFSRVSHVRWLRGDLDGAIAAMELALRATHARDAETRAWLLTRLSSLQLQRGDAAVALHLADAANTAADAYPPGLFAQARALVALGRLHDAIAPLQQAAALHPATEYQWWLVDLLAADNRRDEAVAIERELKNRGAHQDPRTLALFLATRGEDTARAVRLARAELTERADVFSHDAVAWACFAAGDLETAEIAMRSVLAEGTKDARLSLHAGEIALARGDAARAAEHFAVAHAAAHTLTPSERARLMGHRPAPAGVAGH